MKRSSLSYRGSSNQNRCPEIWPPPFDLYWPPSLLRPLDRSPSYCPPPPPHPFPASALLDNTPSIWRWRTTHVHNKTTSSKEKTKQGNCPLALPWSETLFFFALIFVICKNVFTFFFYTRVFLLSYIDHPAELGTGIKGRGSCVRIRVWHLSDRTKANSTTMHMHANINSLQSWWGTRKDIRGFTISPLSKTHKLRLDGGRKNRKLTKNAETGNVSGNEIKKEKIFRGTASQFRSV